MRDTVLFLDTTLRDGEQTPGVSFHLNDKVDFARALETLGVDMIEAGFAGASPGDFEAVRAVARTVKTGVCSLARCVEADIRAAADALKGAAKPRIHVFIATSPLHRAAKLNMTREQVLDAAVRSVRLARSLCADVEFSCEDATRTETDFKSRLIEWGQKNKRRITFSTVNGEAFTSQHPTFRSTVLLDGAEIGTGEGGSKKEAEQRAAMHAAERLRETAPEGAFGHIEIDIETI